MSLLFGCSPPNRPRNRTRRARTDHAAPLAGIADPWDRYGRVRPADDHLRGVDGRLYWDWYQRIGPGAEILGDLAGRTVADLGAGAGRQAAHIAGRLGARTVLAVDASGGRIARGREVFGHVPALEFVHADAVTALRAAPGTLDVAYSCFGAADFTDPRALLPAVAGALRPGGALVLSTLAHHKGGHPPEDDVRPATIAVRRDDGTTVGMQRWVLGTAVWTGLLAAYGFTDLVADVLRDPGGDGRPPMATTLIRATRRIPAGGSADGVRGAACGT